MDDSYRIQLPQFEGPFDLLLFFIERDELDIHDIPIAQITQDFLDYMQEMNEMNIELAAEFILVASTLMRIKAKMLLPRPVLNEAGEVIDPREELVQRLLEYKRYKEVISDIAQLEEAQMERNPRGYVKPEEKLFLKSEFPEEELHGLDLYSILKAFKRIWERHNEKIQRPQHVIRKYPFTLNQVKQKLRERLETVEKLDFAHFVLEEGSKMFMIFGFLSILELVQVQKIGINIGEGYNNFWVYKIVSLDEESDEEEEAEESYK
ncbi:MAG: segregation/condensation protein A [Bacteroidia bacterium]|nr:segregation/condensation protein A [Bacteroidia bacterium]